MDGIDMISREQVLNVIADFVTFEEYIDENHHLTFVPLEKKINLLPSVQPKPIECDDCVSRGAVVDLLNMRLFGKELFKALYELPSVQPKPNYCAGCKHNTNNEICLECEYDGITRGMTKYVPMSQPSRKGHWILDKDKSLLFNVYKCSNCENIGAKETNFCPNCGADMRGDTDGNT